MRGVARRASWRWLAYMCTLRWLCNGWHKNGRVKATTQPTDRRYNVARGVTIHVRWPSTTWRPVALGREDR